MASATEPTGRFSLSTGLCCTACLCSSWRCLASSCRCLFSPRRKPASRCDRSAAKIEIKQMPLPRQRLLQHTMVHVKVYSLFMYIIATGCAVPGVGAQHGFVFVPLVDVFQKRQDGHDHRLYLRVCHWAAVSSTPQQVRVYGSKRCAAVVVAPRTKSCCAAQAWVVVFITVHRPVPAATRDSTCLQTRFTQLHR